MNEVYKFVRGHWWFRPSTYKTWLGVCLVYDNAQDCFIVTSPEHLKKCFEFLEVMEVKEVENKGFEKKEGKKVGSNGSNGSKNVKQTTTFTSFTSLLPKVLEKKLAGRTFSIVYLVDFLSGAGKTVPVEVVEEAYGSEGFEEALQAAKKNGEVFEPRSGFLQGFPDGYTEGVSDTQRYKQLGNSVTVNVIQDIAKRWK